MTSSPTALLVRGGRVLDPDGELDRPPVADILIEAGRIRAVGEGASAAEARQSGGVSVLDASDMLVVPGFINAHYHSHDVLFRGLFEQMPLEVWGLFSFPHNYTRRSDAEVRARTLLGAIENLRSGITTTQDMVTVVGPDHAHVDAITTAYRESGIRVVLGLQLGDVAAPDTVPFWREELSPALLAELGVAVDPAPMQRLIEELFGRPLQERLHWALAPSAPQRCSEPLLRWVAAMAQATGAQVFTHVYETRGQAVLARLRFGEDGKSLIRHLDRMGLLGPSLTVAHGVWIADDEVARFGAAGANLAFNPMSNLKLRNGVAPIREYAQAGANLSLGCDNCSGNDAQNIFESMKAFALFWGLQGQAGETGAAREAFRAATLGGARALGLEHDLGAIRPGFRADLTLLNLGDPAFLPLNSAVRQLVYAGSPRAVDTVIVDGAVVVSHGRATQVEEAAIAALAVDAHTGLEAELHSVRTRNAHLARELLRVHERILRTPLDIDRLTLV
jgi:5-methylthioadenosine/S-adenosylhomocysteine deaminase